MLKFVHTMSEDIITNINVFNNPSTFYIYIYIYYWCSIKLCVKNITVTLAHLLVLLYENSLGNEKVIKQEKGSNKGGNVC